MKNLGETNVVYKHITFLKSCFLVSEKMLASLQYKKFTLSQFVVTCFLLGHLENIE